VLHSPSLDANVTLAAYNSGMCKTLLLYLLSVAACGLVTASPLYVSTSGVFSSSDSSGALVAPNKPFTLQFAVDTNPTPLSGTVTSLGFDVPVLAFSYSLNNVPVNASPREIRFSSLANGGLFDITFGSGLNAAEFAFEGPQIFSGSTSSPAFAVNKYPVSSWTYSDPINYDVETPVALSVAVTPTPEPSSILLLLCGGIALLTVSIQKSVRVR